MSSRGGSNRREEAQDRTIEATRDTTVVKLQIGFLIFLIEMSIARVIISIPKLRTVELDVSFLFY